jgi:hypothetical protein
LLGLLGLLELGLYLQRYMNTVVAWLGLLWLLGLYSALLADGGRLVGLLWLLGLYLALLADGGRLVGLLGLLGLFGVRFCGVSSTADSSTR